MQKHRYKPPRNSKPPSAEEFQSALADALRSQDFPLLDTDHPGKHPETDMGDVLWILAKKKWTLSQTSWDPSRNTWKYVLHADGTDGRRRRLVLALHGNRIEIITRFRREVRKSEHQPQTQTPISKQDKHE